MTRQTKKHYLESYRLQQAKIKRFRDLMIELPDKRDLYHICIEKVEQFRKTIEKQIEKVDGTLLSEILFQKYVCGKTLEEIALLLNYSHRQIERLHIKALENFSVC